MQKDIHREVLTKLAHDYQFKSKNGWLREGKCPRCEKHELYTNEEHPWVLRCGRLAKCGAEFHVKELYPDIFEAWSERHPATPENPNAAADAYLQFGRGFDLKMIAGWYTQESYWDKESGQGSATVRFALGSGTWWERIIDKPQRFGKRKATFRGDYKGLWWQPTNGVGIPRELWIVEGIFDAIALLHHNIAAVATMSSNNYPGATLQALAEQCAGAGKERPTLVWALDGDAAGRKFGRRWCEQSRKQGWQAVAAVIPQSSGSKLDWNDAHQHDRLKPENLKEYLYHGALLMAASASEKGNLIYSRHGWNTFPFDFDNRIWWWKTDLEKFAKEQDRAAENKNLSEEEIRAIAISNSHTVSQICSCRPTPLYYLKNEVTDEAWYHFRIDFPHDGPSVKAPFTAGQITATAEFKKRLMHVGAGAIWRGNAAQLDRLMDDWTFNIKTVETVDFIGYSIEHDVYVYNEVAIKAGQVANINDEDYFELPKLAIKSLQRSLKLDISTDQKAQREDWFDKFHLVFGIKGVVALAAWMGTLFAEQIRARFESYPFVELVGEPGAGKTLLLETMWKLLGRNGYEGFDPMKGSQVGFMRSMAQVANMPVVLIESDREEDADGAKGRPRQAFHWDSLKSLYNGGSLRTTGVKSSGNDTYDPQFRAALVISQNAPVQASTPIMERIVHIGFDKSRHTDEGREAALELNRMAAADVSGFLVRAVTHEKQVLDLVEQHQRTFEKRMEAIGVKNQRIQKNHAQFMVLVHALQLACPITESTRTEAVKMLAELALEREQALAKDHPVVERFWEAYEYLNGTGDGEDDGCVARLNHSANPELIAINLNHFVQVAAEMRQQVPDLHDLKRLLKTSRQRKYVDYCAVNSAINRRYNSRLDVNAIPRPSTLKCWVFKR